MKIPVYFFLHYNNKHNIEYILNYNNNLLGSNCTQIYNISPLLNENEENNGEINFINTNKSLITFPPQYKVIENITINIKNKCQCETTIYASNYYESETSYYPNGSKQIIPIISCTGEYVGRTGYIVIDADGSNRNVTIRLD